MWIAGIVLLLLAAGVAYFARHQRAKARSVTATETLTTKELDDLAGGVAAEVGGGSFRQRCEVVGAAAAGPSGLNKAPHSDTDVVWFRAEVTHRYWKRERRTRDGKTHYERVEHEDTVSDITSKNPFVVDDRSGGTPILVAPDGATIDRPEQTVDRFEQGQPQRRSGSTFDKIFDVLITPSSDSGTIGFTYREWVIRPGARLYVHGEVADDTGVLRFAKPATKGRYIISTRSEEQIVGQARSHAKWANVAAVTAAVAGVVLVVVGLIAG